VQFVSPSIQGLCLGKASAVGLDAVPAILVFTAPLSEPLHHRPAYAPFPSPPQIYRYTQCDPSGAAYGCLTYL
jgi:hypothetical protein